MELSGVSAPGEYDDVVFRGEPSSGEYIAFWLSGGRVTAGMNVNVWDVTSDIQAIIGAGDQVDVGRLTDPKVPLADLVR
jgi:3-phenylpropionate/trans-cinnamate dioxygenase ferredoxin reductase subunit